MDLMRSERGRRVLFSALYLSEGAPIGYLWWALPPRWRAAGVPVAEIAALTAALVLPWTFKFLWAPLVDRLQRPRVGFRVWIVAAQLCMGASLLGLLGLDASGDMDRIAPLLMLHAFAAATQDVAVDGLAVRTVAPLERGRLQGWTQTGMLTGRALFGGGALWLESFVGPDVVLLCLVAVTWSSLVLLALTFRTPEPPAPELASSHAGHDGVLSTLWHALANRRSLFALGFALLSGAGFECLGALAGTLLVDRGVTQASVGSFFAVPTVLAMVLGALAGGRLADRMGRVPAVGLALKLVVGAVCMVAGCDALALGHAALMASLALGYLGIGLFVACSYALFMDLTDPRFGATHFSAFMGATNGCEAWAGWVGGRLQAPLGYPATFTILAGLSLFALPLLRRLRGTDTQSGAQQLML